VKIELETENFEKLERGLTALRMIERTNRKIAILNKIKQRFINQIKNIGEEKIRQYILEQLKNFDEEKNFDDANIGNNL
jgi:hypothetical protein